MFNKANIDVQLVTDTAVLDLIRNKYPYLGLYYFGNHTIQQEWFATHTSYMLDELGERYNRDFNVGTVFSDELSLFIHDRRATEYLNAKKIVLLDEISELLYRSNKRDYLRKLEEVVSALPDVNIETLYHSIEWNSTVRLAVATFLDNFGEELKKLEAERDRQYILSCDSEKERKEREEALKEYHNLGSKIRDIDILINLPNRIEISEREKQLLYGDILTIYGKAGIGKSQLLASKTQSLLDEGRIGVLLVAGIYFTDDPVHEQIMKNLRLDYSFEDLIDILETIGERDNCIVPIFIDALNETWNRKLWKSGLLAIIDKIKENPMVKLILSYRPEYEKLILSDSFLEGRGDIVTMLHRGFEDNSISAAREFLNHYNIPFTPLEYFGYEMSNPLFLTLYCKTYNGEEVSLPILYDRVIEHANSNISRVLRVELRQKGYTEDDDILSPLIMEIAEWLVSHDERSISQKDLAQLFFWTEYGLNAVPFVRHLVKEHILHDSIFDGKETLYFAFDQMNDYYCAKAIMKKRQSKDEVRRYLSEKILGIKNGEMGNSWNIDLFVNACALYAAKYGEECIDIIDDLENSDHKWQVFSRYIDSFQWRDTRYIPTSHFRDLLKKYPCSPEDLWPMLIGNSVKVSHPFNADFLHHFLLSYKLNKRDYLWTIYVNELTEDDNNRIVQLIQMYDKGEKLEISNEKQIELLLTLFGWILTSSNRWLRDYTSKAMIEILKEHFHLCQIILAKFKKVNDPYIIQRLYGIVFGACCKRIDAKSFQTLAEVWLETKGIFFDELKDTLILTDHHGIKWICLTKYCDTGRKDLNTEKLLVWSWLYAYFVSLEQADELFRCAGNGQSVITHDTASHHETSSVFNREYPWSPSCKELNAYAWVDVQIKTGEYETVKEIIEVPDISLIEALFCEHGGLVEDKEQKEEEFAEDGEEDFEIPSIQFKERIRKREIEKEIGKILHATTDLLWEAEYDATTENVISQSLPCSKLIETMSLRQQQEDGFYYDSNGILAAFDTDLTQKVNSVVVRKDILDTFLSKTRMKLVWLVDAEKEIHAGDYSITKWSDWEAVFIYEGDGIAGEIHRLQGKES